MFLTKKSFIKILVKTNVNLIVNETNKSPDYFCTQQTQLYATNDGKPEKQRAIIGEKALFNKERPFGWAYFYEKARKDLFLVLDDSWDVPFKNAELYYGSLQLNGEKFPKAVLNVKTNTEALKNLCERIKKQVGKALAVGFVHKKVKQQTMIYPKQNIGKSG